MKIQSLSRLELAIYFILIFIVLNEWLNPIFLLTNTGYSKLILLFIALSLCLKWINVNVIISWVIRVVYICWFIVFVYDGSSFFSLEGFIYLLDVIRYNLSFVITFDFKSITDPFRTIMLFVLIWMLIYLIHHWIVYKLNVFYFLLMAVIFITTLDTFTEYDGSIAIVKIIIIGLIISAFLFLKRLINEQGLKVENIKYLKMALPIIVIVGCFSLVSILLPKAAPQWPDPVPYIKSATGAGGLLGNKVSKVGYDEDDSQLGGPFIEDNTVVFKVIDNQKQYWRVETKDIYTSKGWESSQNFGNTIYNVGEMITPFLPIGDDKNEKMATVIYEGDYDFLIYPYGIKTVNVNNPVNTNLVIDENDEKFTLTSENERYFVQYSTPTFQYSTLLSTEEELDDYSMMNGMYLQLPDTLPQRVIDLAEEIVEGKNTPYEKARAIELYFRQNGFRYDTKNVPVPAEDQDYVDQFLFETKIGYCDNFSTSMVVLLRSVGIPARWVKGFVTGDLIEVDGGKNVYEITNNEAHSWVEAFIPGVGWVNFEPTIGFTNNRSIDFDIESDTTNEDMVEAEEETKPQEQIEKEEETKKDTKETTKQTNNFFTKNVLWISLILIALLVITILMFIFRKKWLWKVALRKLKNNPMEEGNFEQHYLLLLKVLESKGIHRKDGQTLSSFAREVDEKYNTDLMSEITSKYEQFIYSKQSTEIDFMKMKEIWQFLVNYSAS